MARKRARIMAAERYGGFAPGEFTQRSQAKRKAAVKNCPWITGKIAEARRDFQPIGRFQPLFRHLLNLAIDNAQNGNCKRAGYEIGQAKALARRYGFGRED
jgi:hypothetical protein